MRTTTYADLCARLGATEIPEDLIADAEIPVISGKPQAQGDIIFLPWREGVASSKRAEVLKSAVPVTQAGVPLVVGENGGNTHFLVPDPFGVVKYHAYTNTRTIGVVVVEEGAAYVHHPEHGVNGLGTGVYVCRRQVQQLDQIELVRD